MTNKSIDFYHGLFGGTAIAKLSIFPDGISIDAKSNSGLLDQFLDDLLQWSRSELGISTVQTYRFGRLYQSDIVFHSDKDILVPFEGVAQMQSMLNKKFLETSKVDINWRPVGWSLGYDPIDVGSVKPNPFHVARRVGTDYSLNHYFSTAPLRTSDHIELIEALERIV
jgi:hypothetical protein